MNDTNKSINECNGITPELSRELSLFHLTMMGAGMMIGAGVFVATGISIGISGSGGILITFVLNGLIAICSAMSFAELSSALPAAGGAYTYIKEAFGGIIGFISGWMNWFALSVAGSLYAITFSTYTLHLLKGFELFAFLNAHLFIYEKILALLIAIIFIIVNYRGVSEAGNSATLIALGQTVTLGIIGVIGVAVALTQPERLTNFQPFISQGWGKILVTMGFTYVGFEGFEVIGHAGEEAIDPKRNIPKAILYAVIIVVTTYLLVAFAAVVGVKPEGTTVVEWFSQRGATGFADAIKNLFPFGGILVTLAAIFSSTSALNATIYSSARVSFAIARDGQLPKKLATVCEKRKVPHIALFLSSIIVLVVAAALPVEDVAASADIMFLLIFLLINVSVIKIRKERKDELEYGFMMPFFPAIPIFALVAQLLLSIWLFDMSAIAWAATIIWITLGIIIYFAYTRKACPEEEKEMISFRERIAIKAQKPQIVVPIGNSENAETLVNFSEKVAASRKLKLSLLGVVTVPGHIPLKEAKEFGKEKREILGKVCKTVKDDYPIDTVIRYSRDIARGIISAVKERNTALVVLGWKGYTKYKTFSMGNIMDRVIEQLPCNIVVVKPGKAEENNDNMRKILLPSRGGNNDIMAARIAKDLVNSYGAHVTILNVNHRDEFNDRIERRLRPIIDQFGKYEYDLQIVEGDDITEEILRKSEEEDYDTVILGATEEGFLQQLLFGNKNEKIAKSCNKTVILAKKDSGMKSWFNRWIGRRKFNI